MPSMDSNEVAVISGQRGTGKSTLMRMIAKSTKFVIVYDPMFEHGILGTITNNIDGIGNLQRVVFQPINNTRETFEKFCDHVWRTRQNVTVFIDELDEHATVNFLPPNFGKLLRLGRHKGIGVVGLTRRIANLNKTAPAQSHHIISFKQTLPNDIEYLMAYIGKENAVKLTELEKFEYLWHNFVASSTFIGKTKKI